MSKLSHKVALNLFLKVCLVEINNMHSPPSKTIPSGGDGRGYPPQFVNWLTCQTNWFKMGSGKGSGVFPTTSTAQIASRSSKERPAECVVEDD